MHYSFIVGCFRGKAEKENYLYVLVKKQHNVQQRRLETDPGLVMMTVPLL